MIRKATPQDISAIATLYDKAIDYEDMHVKYTSWQKGIYPTEHTAELAQNNGSLFVCEQNDRIVASVILDAHQPPEYRNIDWQVSATSQQVLVIHTLCVDPELAGSGIGSALIDFAKQLAKECNYLSIRLNTSVRNALAIHLYQKNGFEFIATQKMLLDGQIYCNEHLFMEYLIK